MRQRPPAAVHLGSRPDPCPGAPAGLRSCPHPWLREILGGVKVYISGENVEFSGYKISKLIVNHD